MTRTSIACGCVAPSGTTSRSCNTRSNFAWSPTGISAISSSRIVPLFAARKKPSPPDDAPVNAPFWCPNSIASSMLSGSAAQLIATNGPFLRGELLWIARASTSLPVPVGPLMSTVISASATRSASASKARLSGSAAVGISGPAISARAKPLPTAASAWPYAIRAAAPSRCGMTNRVSPPMTNVRDGTGDVSPSATSHVAPSCARAAGFSTAKPCARSDETSATWALAMVADGTIERMHSPFGQRCKCGLNG